MSQQQSQNLGFLESKGEKGKEIWFCFLSLGKGFPTILSFPTHTPPKTRHEEKQKAHKLKKNATKVKPFKF